MTNLPELVILKYLLNTTIYNKYYRYINKDIIKEKYIELYKLYLTLEDLHTKLPSKEIKSFDEFEAWFYSCYSALKPDEVKAFELLLNKLRDAELSDGALEQLVEVLAQRAQASVISKVAFEVAEGRRPQEDLEKALSDKLALGKSVSHTYAFKPVTTRIKELRLQTIQKAGLRWPLKCLNKSLGSLRKGDFGFVFARPETGKTTELAHTATFMAPQARALNLGPVAWVNNEEQGEKVQIRAMQAYFGITLPELFAREDHFQAIYDKEIGEHFKLFDDATTSRSDVEDILEQEKPGLLILDQIDKIRGFEADRPDLVFGKIYQWARELCKEYCPIIGTCQASGDAEGVRWLSMDHVAEAKTSKQAEADWILGIGKSNDEGTESFRYFNLSKNKLIGDADSDPNLRHGRFSVFIRPTIARYEDIELDE